MKNILFVLLSIVLMISCYNEDALTPSEGTEEIFQIPQGNHSYDSVVVDWFDRYGFYALYIFEEKDLYWYNEEWIEGGRPELSNAGSEIGKAADEEYVGYALDMFDKFMLCRYPEELVKNGMPLRVFLCSGLWNCSVDYEFDDKGNVNTFYVYEKIWVYEGWDNIAVNGASSYITDSLMRDDQLAYSAALNGYFLEHLADEGLIPLPCDDFFSFSTYENETDYGLEVFANGYLRGDINDVDLETYMRDDFLSYCRLAGYPLDVLNGEAIPEDDFADGYNPPLEGLFSRPESELCKQKYEIVVEHLKSLGVDMEKIQYPDEVSY